MKILKIGVIKEYKSFFDFGWSRFCLSKEKKEKNFEKFNVVFGENGSGKSSVVDLFKDLFQYQPFSTQKPKHVVVCAKSGGQKKNYSFEEGLWSGGETPGQGSAIFFDVDFINRNIHTHGTIARAVHEGGHTQRAGQLIIYLDQKASEYEAAIKNKERELEDFIKANSLCLSREFSKEDRALCKDYCQIDVAARANELVGSEDGSHNLQEELGRLEVLNKKQSKIAELKHVHTLGLPKEISRVGVYDELGKRRIKENVQEGVDEAIKRHFLKHRGLIEQIRGLIPSDFDNEPCPFCMQPLANAADVINFYRVAFDKSYDREKQKYISDIEEIKGEIVGLIGFTETLSEKIAVIFHQLESAASDFGIANVYSLEQKVGWQEKMQAISALPDTVNSIFSKIDQLLRIDKNEVDLVADWQEMERLIKQLVSIITEFNQYVEKKNELISSFKKKYSLQENVSQEIKSKKEALAEVKKKIDFLSSDKMAVIKEQDEKLVFRKRLQDAVKSENKALAEYLSVNIPILVIERMTVIINRFNLDIDIRQETPSTKTKDYSFSFNVFDRNGNERTIKDGLSEGERQIISLAFFFAVHEKVVDKDKKILVLDDPITSLDAPNLKILSDIIFEETERYGQVFVFTHHPLFFKYLSKHGNATKFGILKNDKRFGGSFLYYDPGFDLIDEVRRCGEEVNLSAQRGALNPEVIAIKYGQLLRLSVEKFIKRDLLMWDTEKTFDKITETLKQGKSAIGKIPDEDFDTLDKVYRYCNWSNLLHTDKEAPSALGELTNHISNFVKVIERSKQ